MMQDKVQMKPNNEMEVIHDKEYDIVLIKFGPPTVAISEPLAEGVYIRREPKTDRIASIVIEDYSRRHIETLLEFLPVKVSRNKLP